MRKLRKQNAGETCCPYYMEAHFFHPTGILYLNALACTMMGVWRSRVDHGIGIRIFVPMCWVAAMPVSHGLTNVCQRQHQCRRQCPLPLPYQQVRSSSLKYTLLLFSPSLPSLCINLLSMWMCGYVWICVYHVFICYSFPHIYSSSCM